MGINFADDTGDMKHWLFKSPNGYFGTCIGKYRVFLSKHDEWAVYDYSSFPFPQYIIIFAGINNFNHIYHWEHAVGVISCGGLPPIPPDPSLCVYVGHWVMADFPSHRDHRSMHCARAKQSTGCSNWPNLWTWNLFKDNVARTSVCFPTLNSFR